MALMYITRPSGGIVTGKERPMNGTPNNPQPNSSAEWRKYRQSQDDADKKAQMDSEDMMEGMMKVGDVVKVYQKPMTEEDFEGEAELIERIPFNLPGFEMWKVHFLNDDPLAIYHRTFYIGEN